MKQVADGREKTKETKLSCPVHGEYWGFVMKANGRDIKGACPVCIEDERLSELMEIAKGQKARERIDVFNQSCVPKRFLSCNFASYKPVCKEAEEIKELLCRYVQNFEKVMERGTSFLFSGGTGTGKTTLATAILNNIMHRGFTGVYVSSLNYLSKIKRSWAPNTLLSEDELIEEYVKFDLLVIDELGKGVYSQKEKGIIFRLLDRRYEDNKPTIGISIHKEEKICKLVDPDALRRLTTGGGGTLKFSWGNYEKTQGGF